MNRQFMHTVYEQWEEMNIKQTTGFEELIETQRKEVTAYINTLKEHWIDKDSLAELQDAINALQADAHHQGFYTGFETACHILHEMTGCN